MAVIPFRLPHNSLAMRRRLTRVVHYARQVAVCHCIIRPQGDSALIACDRLLGFAGYAQCIAEVEVRIRKIRHDLEHLADQLDRPSGRPRAVAMTPSMCSASGWSGALSRALRYSASARSSPGVVMLHGRLHIGRGLRPTLLALHGSSCSVADTRRAVHGCGALVQHSKQWSEMTGVLAPATHGAI